MAFGSYIPVTHPKECKSSIQIKKTLHLCLDCIFAHAGTTRSWGQQGYFTWGAKPCLAQMSFKSTLYKNRSEYKPCVCLKVPQRDFKSSYTLLSTTTWFLNPFDIIDRFLGYFGHFLDHFEDILGRFQNNFGLFFGTISLFFMPHRQHQDLIRV